MPRAANKQRVTYRLEPELAAALKQLPNQTAFVERTLREALAQVCPLCHGTGEATGVHLTVSDLKRSPIGRLDRAAAARLRALVRLGRQLLATDLALEPAAGESELVFRLEREDQILLTGRIPCGPADLELN
ncbi:MAG: hypothetical protein JRG76_12805 [Deltaproteobacteria bacterium]|nr:hypothetical protein [Deltaproteobacteria bacterium]MBW2415379.1 hypothetical protein [Deltaproteobacteria bacterium]